jgi:6-phosphofructokinase 1
MDWMDVSGLVWTGGAELGTNRWVPAETDLSQIAEQFAAQRIDGVLMAGGWSGYAPRTSCTPPGTAMRRWAFRSSACP